MTTQSLVLQYVDAIATFIASIIAITLSSIHAIRWYQDFYTEDRKCVQHRRKKPKLKIMYRRIGHATLVSIIFLSLGMVWTTFNYTLAITIQTCVAFNILSVSSFQIGKFAMYCTFLARLHMIYGDSHHGYNYIILWIIFGYAVLISILFIVFQLVVYGTPILGNANDLFFLDDEEFPFTCDELLNTNETIVFVVIYLFNDLIVNTFYCVLFIIPLRKTMKLLDLSHTDAPKISKKMLAVGTKVSILTGVLCSTSLLFLIIAILTNLAATWVPDTIINILCLMLMTPYYDDEIWYKRLCKICVICCDKSGYSTQKYETTESKNKLTEGSNGSKTPKESADTMSAPRIGVKKYQESSANNLSEIVPSVLSDSRDNNIISPSNISGDDSANESLPATQ